MTLRPGIRWRRWLVAGLCVLTAGAEETAQPAGGPVIHHLPITTAVRGQPLRIAADVQVAGGASLTQASVNVRLGELGKPIPFAMAGGSSSGPHVATIPVTFPQGVSRFWYHVHAADSQGRLADTTWYPVNVVEPPQSAQGTEEGWWAGKGPWVVGGVALAGGGAAILLGQDDDDDDEDEQVEPPAGDDDGPSDGGSGKTPQPCTVTGKEQVYFQEASLDPVDYGTPIQLYVCGACSGATIRVTGSWDAENTVGPYDNPTCSPDQLINLRKPSVTPAPGAGTIDIYSNDQLIESRPWPDAGPSLRGRRAPH